MSEWELIPASIKRYKLSKTSKLSKMVREDVTGHPKYASPRDSTVSAVRSDSSSARRPRVTAFHMALLMPFLIRSVNAACSGDNCAPPEGWDNFVNNLASDLAPLLTLLGEQVTTQYLNESLSWIDSLLFAFAPLGIISAMVAAIRVAGRPLLWSLIGRAKESRGTVEAELMSSTSSDVCELWGGEGVSRVLGSPVLLQLVYVGSGDVEKSEDEKPPTVKNSEGVYLFHEATRLDIYRRKGDVGPSPDIQENVDMEANNDIDDFLTRQNPPNLSLNVSIRPLDPKVLITFACIGFFMQTGVLIYAALSQYHLKLSKSGTVVPAYGFPILLTGTLSLAIGMFLCAQAVETSTKEETWEPTEKGDSKSVVWLQQGGQTVGDQRFGSFARRSGVNFPENRVLTSEKAGKGKPVLVTAAISTAFFGFVAQFVGLRAMHPSVTIAQLGAVLIMTILRSCARIQREGRNDIEDPDEIEGYELDWLAKDLKGCQSWEINTGRETSCQVPMPPTSFEVSSANAKEVTKSTSTLIERIWSQASPPQISDDKQSDVVSVAPSSDEEEEIDTSEQRFPLQNDVNAAVMRTRARLARLSHDWMFGGRKKAEVLHNLIEETMNEIFDNMTIREDLKTEREISWSIPVEASFKDSTTNAEQINLIFSRKLNENQSFGAWTIEKSELEAVLCLWTSSIVRADRQRARDRLPRFKRVRILACATELTSTHYNVWVPRARNPKLERVYDDDTRYYGYTRAPSRDQVSSSGYLYVDAEGDSSTLCAQELYSLFIFELAGMVQDIGGVTTPHNKDAVTRATGTLDGPNTEAFRLHNSNLEHLADIYNGHGLGSTEDAYFSIISAFGSAGKLPYPYETCLEVMNNSEELARSGKWRDGLENDSWLYKNSKSENAPMNLTDVITKPLLEQARKLAKNITRFDRRDQVQEMWEATYSYCKLIRAEKSEEKRALGLVTLCLTCTRANLEFGQEAMTGLLCDTIQYFGGKKMHNNQDFKAKVQMLWNNAAFSDFRFTARFLWENTVDAWLQSNQEQCPLISRVLIDVLRDIGGVLFNVELQRYFTTPICLKSAAAVTADHGISIEESKDPLFPIDLLLIRKYRSPVQMAAEVGNLQILQALLEAGADIINEKPAPHYGRTALQAAAGAGHLNIVSLLIDKGAKKDEEPAPYYGRRALQAAAGAGHLKVVKFLCNDLKDIKPQGAGGVVSMPITKVTQKADATKDAGDGKNYSPDDIAFASGAPAPHHGRTALQAAAEGGHIAIVEYLLDIVEVTNETTSDPGVTALEAAASGGHEAIVMALIKAGADIDESPESPTGKTALEAAVSNGHIGTIKSLLRCNFNRQKTLVRAIERGYNDVVRHLFSHAGVKPNVNGEDAQTLLDTAANHDRSAIIKILKDNGLNIENINGDGRTALHMAALQGDLKQAQALLKGGSDLEKRDNLGDTPLTLAAYFSHPKMVDFLLKQGADIHRADNYGNTALQNSLRLGKESSQEVVEILLDNGAEIERADNLGDTALTLATQYADKDVVEYLLKRGADIHKVDDYGGSVLHHASISEKDDRVEIIELLLANGADIERANVPGGTPFLVAAQNGHIPQAEALLKHGADIKKTDNLGDTAMTLAVAAAQTEMVEFLINNGADIHRADNYGNTPIHHSALSDKGDCTKIIEILLQHGANLETSNGPGRTPLLVAAQSGNVVQAEALLKHGADIKKIDNLGDTALSLAAFAVKEDMVEFLLKNGADVHTADKEGNSALQNAIIFGKEASAKIVECLCQYGADIERPNNEGLSALQIAVRDGYKEVETILQQALKDRAK